jgi:hypothetical protein
VSDDDATLPAKKSAKKGNQLITAMKCRVVLLYIFLPFPEAVTIEKCFYFYVAHVCCFMCNSCCIRCWCNFFQGKRPAKRPHKSEKDDSDDDATLPAKKSAKKGNQLITAMKCRVVLLYIFLPFPEAVTIEKCFYFHVAHVCCFMQCMCILSPSNAKKPCFSVHKYI